MAITLEKSQTKDHMKKTITQQKTEQKTETNNESCLLSKSISAVLSFLKDSI